MTNIHKKDMDYIENSKVGWYRCRIFEEPLVNMNKFLEGRFVIGRVVFGKFSVMLLMDTEGNSMVI